MPTYTCCKDCIRRKLGCHSGCEEYAKERIVSLVRQGQKRRAARTDRDVHAFTMSSIRRNRTG